jgi:hypothetical protein
MICASHPVAPHRHWRGHLIGREARCQRHATTTRQASGAARPRGGCRRCRLPPICLAPRGQEREHTSYFVTDAEPHPATSGYMGRRGPRRDILRRSDCSQAVNLRDEVNFEKSTLNCTIGAPSRTRTCGLLLRRQVSTVAGHGWTWPGVPSTSHVRGWTWPGMAWCLWSLAPRLAPRFR